jgi:transcriptional regulator with XRE-family HTH domain
MLSDQIKKYRRARGLSQEDLAAQLHVVRQTLSKWENALSVPDADQLIALARVLEVRVNDLLKAEMEAPYDTRDIAAELAKANEQIAQYAEAGRLRTQVGRIRGRIIWLSVLAVVIMHAVGNEILAISLSALLFIASLVILYRYNILLSVEFSGEKDTGGIRAVTVFDMILVALVAGSAILVKTGTISLPEKQEEFFAAALVAIVILFAGLIAPQLPYNRHTGLRLPWTVQNEGAWNIAHKVLGIISVPLGLTYLSLTLFVKSMKVLTLVIVVIWIGVPGLISLLYVIKLSHMGRRK